MKLRKRAAVMVLLVPFVSVLPVGLTPLGAAQDTKQIRLIRESFIVVPACHGCYPVEVTGIALSGYPLEVILGQATVENRSERTVIAVKLAWKVHGFIKGMVPLDLRCGVPPESKVFLSGNTPLISLGQLAPKETCHIGPNPLIGKAPATHTVFVDYPILSTDDVKTLPVDEARRAVKYAISFIRIRNSFRGWYNLGV